MFASHLQCVVPWPSLWYSNFDLPFEATDNNMLEMLILVCIKFCSTILVRVCCIFAAISQIVLILPVALLVVLALGLKCRFPAHLEGVCQCTTDIGLLGRICADAVYNVRSYIKASTSLFCPPHCFPFEESKYAPHLLLDKLDFLIPSICAGLGFHPFASERYTNEDQQDEIISVHMLTVIKLFFTQRS